MSLSFLIFGYRRIFFKEENASLILTLLLRGGVRAKFVSKGELLLSQRDFVKAREILSDKFEYTFSEIKGFRGVLEKSKRRYGFFAAIFILAALSFFSYNTVFDIRVNGNEQMTEQEVLDELEAAGFSVGSSWIFSDRTDIEARVLAKSENIGWINVNRRGSVAYIEIIEKRTSGAQKPTYKYANVIADRDCVIEEITVKKGYATVKVGDTVRRGDVLISGVPIDATGSFCIAEGTVIGRVNESLEVVCEKKQTVRIEKDEKLRGFSVKILDFPINIFKIYGNSVSECDIIERKTDFVLFGKRLPVVFSRSYTKSYTEEKAELSESELFSLARNKTAEKILAAVGDGELLKARSHGALNSEEYKMITEIVYIKNVSQHMPFEVQ